MKTRMIILAGFLLFIMSGCLVKSLHQFYHEEDVIFNEDLIGNWYDEDSCLWKINQYKYSKGFMQGDTLDNSYLVEILEEPDNASRFNAHLFGLAGKEYLDFAPLRDDSNQDMLDIHLVSTHTIAKIEFISDGEVMISWFNDEWLPGFRNLNMTSFSGYI